VTPYADCRFVNEAQARTVQHDSLKGVLADDVVLNKAAVIERCVRSVGTGRLD
jgi:hypothetical protein